MLSRGWDSHRRRLPSRLELMSGQFVTGGQRLQSDPTSTSASATSRRLRFCSMGLSHLAGSLSGSRRGTGSSMGSDRLIVSDRVTPTRLDKQLSALRTGATSESSARNERLTFLRGERARTRPRSFRVWHQGNPIYSVTSVQDPPEDDARYHRRNGVATWYGSRTERGAWAELFRHFLDDGVSPFEVLRRVGRVDAHVIALDLTSTRVRRALGVTLEQLISDNLELCQELAGLAVEAGFEAIHAPAATLPNERTIAVFGSANSSSLRDVQDKGVRRAPVRLYDVLRAIRIPAERALTLGSFFERLTVEWELRRARSKRGSD